MHILEDMDISRLNHESRLQGIIPEEDLKAELFDVAFADKVIRRCKKSLYPDYLHLWENDFSSYNWLLGIRELFYRNQIKEDEISLALHDNTVMITFDGSNASGKSSLQQQLRWYFQKIDPGLFDGRSKDVLASKASNFGPDSIHAESWYHQKKVEEGERVQIVSLDFLSHMFEYALALTRYAVELPPLLFLDRFYLTSLAKATPFVHQREKEIFERVHPPADERKFWELEYLIQQMKDKYLVPDLSVILLCDKKTSVRRQNQRENEGKKPSKKVDVQELGWYYFFQQKNLIPNALYLDTTSKTITEEFREIVIAIKERCEDKGRYTLAEKITTQSIDYFIQQSKLT